MSAQPKLTKLQKELVDRYVLTPLSYWSDGSLESKDTGDTMITGKILEVKHFQKRVFVDFIYEEYNGEKI